MNDAPPVTRTPRSFHRSDIRNLDLSLHDSCHLCKQSGSLEAGCECPRPLAAFAELDGVAHGLANRAGDGAGISWILDPSAVALGDELGRVAAGSCVDARPPSAGVGALEPAAGNPIL